MGTGFKKFKNKIILDSIWKSLAIGISLGLFVMAVPYAVIKFVPIDFKLWVFYIVGAVVMLAGSLVAYFVFFRVSDIIVAKKLDKKLCLGEKVQTMVENRSRQGVMLEIQREDTERILDEIPLSQYKQPKLWWMYIVVVVVCLALAVTVIAIPAPIIDADDGGDTPTYEHLTPWQETALKELIETVRKSKMEDTLKTKLISELEGLLDTLEGGTPIGNMKAQAITSIVTIKEDVEIYDSYDEIAVALNVTDNESIKKFAAMVYTFGGENIDSYKSSIKTHFDASNIDVEGEAFNQEVMSLLENSGVSNVDILYVAIKSFADGLLDIANRTQSLGVTKTQKRIDDLFESATAEIGRILQNQSVNESVGRATINKLKEIFSIVDADLPSDSNGNNNDEDTGLTPPPDEDEGIHDGGLGSGETIFGSDDLLYDPYTESYVKLGDIFYNEQYYPRIIDILQYNDISDEVAKAIYDYFTVLSDGTQNNG